MSFACNESDCPKLSESECSCPSKMRFCPEHMTKHCRSALCDTKNILKEIIASKKKFQDVEKVLNNKKGKLISTANEMILEINKILKIGLEYIEKKQKDIKVMKKTLNTEFLCRQTQHLDYVQYIKNKFEDILKYQLSFLSLNSNPNEDITTSERLDQKKYLLLAHNFEGFREIYSNQDLLIKNILGSNDKKYIFLCKL